MKVLIISQCFYPEKTGISVTATDCANFISEFGHKVSVICGMPFYPEWKIHNEYKRKLLCTETLGSLTLKRVWLYVPAKATTLKRIIHELSFSLLASLRALFRRFDLLICISPPLTAGFVAAIISIVRRRKLWLFVKDIQPDAAVGLGMLRNKRIIKLMFWVEKFIYDRSEKVLVLSEGMARNLESKDVPRAKIIIVPDSIDIEELSATASAGSKFRREYSLEDKFLILYSGNIGVKQNPTIIVECAKRLAHRSDVFFAIVGEGAMKATVQSLIDQYGLQNIAMYPLRERADLGDMLSSADILLAPQRKEVIDIVVPSKMIAYLTSRKPVLASAHPQSEIARMLNEHDAGVIVEPENVEAMVDAILSLKEDRKKAMEIGGRGYTFVSTHFSHQVVKEKYYKQLFST